ncbi:MAG TPA: histidine kinase, partial [Jiangellales bacterium]|nr:histidine kinase [Jiangellales bacterium]
MGVRAGATPVSRPAAVGLGALVALAVGAGGVLLAARADGVSYWGTSLALALGLPVSVVVTAALGWRVLRRADRVLGRWVLALAASLLLYLAAVTVVTRAVAVEGRTGTALDWIAVEALGGFATPLVLLQVSLLVARDRFAGTGNRRFVMVAALVAVLLANLLLGAASLDPDPPLDGLQAPLGDTWLRVVADSWVAGVLYLAWLLSVLVGPVALWRAVGRSSGMARRRLSVATVVSLLPVSVIACCAVLLPVLAVADLPDAVAVEVIFAFFCLAVPATVAGLAVAAGEREEGLRLSSRGLEISVGTVVGVLAALVAVAASTVVAVAVADSVPLVVVATVAVVSLLVPARRAVVRRLLRRADPRLATAAELVREVEDAGADHPGASVREVLRAALGDPDVDVAVRLPDGRSWATVDGAPASPPDDLDADHLTRVGDSDGQARAYVRHTTTAADAAGVVGVARPLLERAVLEAAVRDQSERLAAERSRADRAAEDERRRLERDLHDGVQGRLLAVALDLQAADAATEDGGAHLVLTDAVGSL